MSEFVLQLDVKLKLCPVPWFNFIRHLQRENKIFPNQKDGNRYRPSTEEDKLLARKIINEELSLYGAIKDEQRVYFEDESYYTAFALRFGTIKV